MTRRRKKAPRALTKKLYEVSAWDTVRRDRALAPQCVLATSPGAAIRQIVPPGGRVERERDGGGAYVVYDKAGNFGYWDIHVARGCACVRGSRS